MRREIVVVGVEEGEELRISHGDRNRKSPLMKYGRESDRLNLCSSIKGDNNRCSSEIGRSGTEAGDDVLAQHEDAKVTDGVQTNSSRRTVAPECSGSEEIFVKSKHLLCRV